MRVFQFTNEVSGEEYLCFTEDESATAEDMAFPGFTLSSTDEADLGRVMPGDGDAYFLRR